MTRSVPAMSLITQPERFSDEAWVLLEACEARARSWEHRQMDVEHLLLALLEEPLGDAWWQRLRLHPDRLLPVLEDFCADQPGRDSDALYLGPALDGLLVEANRLARRWGSSRIDTAHLLLALAEDERIGARLLAGEGLSPAELMRRLRLPSSGGPGDGVRRNGHEKPRTLPSSAHRQAGPPTVQTPAGGRQGQASQATVAEHHREPATPRPLPSWRGDPSQGSQGPTVGVDGSATAPEEEDPQEPSQTPAPTALERYSRDLTALARTGVLDPVVGRDREVRQLLQVLSRRSKNNPVLIGDAGVGKTAVTEGLAQRMVAGEVPESLQGCRLLALDPGSLIAGAKYRGQFEERLRAVLAEVAEAEGQVVLLVEELHTLVSNDRAGSDAGSLLKPALARGELRCIATTTVADYRRTIEKDPALDRRFQQVLIREPSTQDCLEILRGLKQRYESHHGVVITDAALSTAIHLADRYINDRCLPDKAIDLIDEAAAQLKMDLAAGPPASATVGAAAGREQVDDTDIAEVVGRWTGIPLQRLIASERQKLLQLEQLLGQRVLGQPRAVAAVSAAIRRARAGMKDVRRPVGSFLFLGPTGVGKTELARALAASLFDEDDALLRLDMSEYMERNAVARLLGAPPGYVGYEEGGQLTEAIRSRPYTVVLLDEVEKAHPDVFNLLLQVLDNGRLTDSQGRTIDFRHTVLVMTSNIAGRQILSAAREQGDEGALDEAVERALASQFRPEFLNRIDEVIRFQPLDLDQIRRIVDLQLGELGDRLREQGLTIQVAADVADALARDGYDPHYGARPIRRLLRRRIENPLATELLEERFSGARGIRIHFADGALQFDAVTPDTAAAEPLLPAER